MKLRNRSKALVAMLAICTLTIGVSSAEVPRGFIGDTGTGDLTKSQVNWSTSDYGISDAIDFGRVRAQYAVITAVVENDQSYYYQSQGTPHNDTGVGAVRYDAGSDGMLIGHVEILDYIFASSPVAVQIEIMKSGSVLRTETVMLDANGDYAIANVNPDTYDVAFKAMSTLSKVVTNVTVPSGGDGTANVTLINGDVDGDNEVTITDLSIVLKYIDTLGD